MNCRELFSDKAYNNKGRGRETYILLDGNFISYNSVYIIKS